jgi:hypothetical protein
MMSRPRKCAPSFAVLRTFAVHEGPSAELLQQAARVARARVVVKLGKGDPMPADSPLAFSHHERGVHVIYWVHTL